MLFHKFRQLLLFVLPTIFISTSISAAGLDYSIISGFKPTVELEDPSIQMQRAESIRMQQEQIRLMQEQRRELEYRNNQQRENQQREEQQRINSEMTIAKDKSKLDSVMQEWLKMASPRLHLFPDFDAVVYSKEVAINTDMIMIMSKSKYAADIAYYFGKHKTESLAISQMPFLEASTAISNVENRIKIALKKFNRVR